ncbi:glycosyltransferase, partial [Bacillus amyloliquefaciens]|uniref:glycosyltransferase n=1 Tax=Bacillus amyloliquefaciens TaxID=1390 RepID=UPI00140508A0
VAGFAAQSRHPVHVAVTRGAAANAGIARHAAMALGMAAWGGDDTLLLTTDADSWPGTDWLNVTVAALDEADLVAGNVLRH